MDSMAAVIRSLAGLFLILGCAPRPDFVRPPEEESLELTTAGGRTPTFAPRR